MFRQALTHENTFIVGCIRWSTNNHVLPPAWPSREVTPEISTRYPLSGDADSICQERSCSSPGQSLGAAAHHDAHYAFMTLSPYTRTREGEARQLGSGPKPF